MENLIPIEVEIIGVNPDFKDILQMTEKIANVPSHVLIHGESGSGRSLIAKAIHLRSQRSHEPFVTIDCANLPDTLLESDLFGHEKGAFTDATSQKQGKFELAKGGTIFMDRINEISPKIQAKFLRVIQEKRFHRLGGSDSITVEARIIASVGSNIEAAIEAGHFREDLYYRLNVIPLKLPPLRERREDVLPLARHFIQKFATTYGRNVNGLNEAATQALLQYAWPGNVRELENMIERIVVLHTQAGAISEEELPIALNAVEPQHLIADGTARSLSLKELEREYIKAMLAATDHHISRTAEILGISRKTLLLKRKKYGLVDGKGSHR